MTKVDSGGAGLGPSAGVVRGRTGSSGAGFGSGGFGAGGPRGTVFGEGGINPAVYRRASLAARAIAKMKGYSPVAGSRALSAATRSSVAQNRSNPRRTNAYLREFTENMTNTGMANPAGRGWRAARPSISQTYNMHLDNALYP